MNLRGEVGYVLEVLERKCETTLHLHRVGDAGDLVPDARAHLLVTEGAQARRHVYLAFVSGGMKSSLLTRPDVTVRATRALAHPRTGMQAPTAHRCTRAAQRVVARD